MKTVHGLAVLLLTLGFTVSPLPVKADAEAQKFLETIYSKYTGQNSPGVVLDSNDVLVGYFTPELAAMIALDAARSQKSDEPPALDGDPFVGAQDWDIKDLSITVKDIAPDKAAGLVSFTNMGEKQIVELNLKKLAQGWRIDDIRWADGTLRGILKGEGDGGEKELPGTQKL